MKSTNFKQKDLNKEKIFLILKNNQNQLHEFGVNRIALFGSYVKNEQNAQRDIDFPVEFYPGKKTYRNFINLVYYLEQLFAKKVEVVTTEALSPYIGPSISREAEYATV